MFLTYLGRECKFKISPETDYILGFHFNKTCFVEIETKMLVRVVVNRQSLLTRPHDKLVSSYLTWIVYSKAIDFTSFPNITTIELNYREEQTQIITLRSTISHLIIHPEVCLNKLQHEQSQSVKSIFFEIKLH